MKTFTNLFSQIVILGLFWFHCLNTLGEKMMELGLEGNRGSRAIGLQKLPAGVYSIVVKEPNGRRCASKLVIQ